MEERHRSGRLGRPDTRPATLLLRCLPNLENDRWWGKGFTEWTNVTRARPQFRGHHQSHLPADLGFYDLRLPDTRRAQADLAREYDISGFCYYHYWFTGRRLLERPFHEVLASGESDFPFCLCWANENWTRTWDGLDRNLLMDQSYSAEDDLASIRWLCETFRDPRYIRIEGRPLLLNRPRSSAELRSSSASTAGRPTWRMRSRLLASS